VVNLNRPRGGQRLPAKGGHFERLFHFLNEWGNSNIGINMRKHRGKIIQKFFFRGQRPKWHPAPSEDIFDLGNCKDKTDMLRFVQPLLNES